ncbi:hypothetical protein K2173_013564 [Erythroxylum novogranatense]|uniref:C2H2-type domain-containing protein n=1 Tax=Erythroxylum novogranatense TaxID=1862640 RepID=A0AAV8TJP4_9ROSI|nr:hypothetical protein K2173_013564 [Erythroxylum novogranatense]
MDFDHCLLCLFFAQASFRAIVIKERASFSIGAYRVSAFGEFKSTFIYSKSCFKEKVSAWWKILKLVALNEWRCGYCKKTFYEEKYLDKHFDNRHYDMLNVTHRRCLADVCGALHCDRVMSSLPHKTKCNPAIAALNKHLCEVASKDTHALRLYSSSRFPMNEGSALIVSMLFLRQFCDSHSCSEAKLFSLGSKKTSVLYIITSYDIDIVVAFYIFMYLYRSASRSGRKKKPS